MKSNPKLLAEAELIEIEYLLVTSHMRSMFLSEERHASHFCKI